MKDTGNVKRAKFIHTFSRRSKPHSWQLPCHRRQTGEELNEGSSIVRGCQAYSRREVQLSPIDREVTFLDLHTYVAISRAAVTKFT